MRARRWAGSATIARVTAVLSLLIILIGLPLAAWWLGGRSFWARTEKRGGADLYGDFVRRHGLRPAETPQVESAVTWGRRLEDPRLRAAAVDWATSAREAMEAYRRRNPLVRRLMVGLLYLWLLMVIASGLVAVVEGRWGAAAMQLVWLVLLVAPLVAFPWFQRRAIELNRD